MIHEISQSHATVEKIWDGVIDFPPIAELLPHTGAMQLIDRLVSMHSNGGLCATTLRANAPYFDQRRFDSFWFVEIMAQAVAAVFTMNNRILNKPKAMGFLIAIDDYQWEGGFDLVAGEGVTIEVILEFDIHPFGQYLTTAFLKGERIASACMKFVVDESRSI